MSEIRVTPFGGDGGGAFPINQVREIGLRTGDLVDQIRINGNAYGSDGGGDRGSITLDADEYISKVEIRSGGLIDHVTFTTSAGNSIGGGGGGGDYTSLSNIRVLGIGGKAGWYVDKLEIMYVSDYQSSSVEASNVGFIISYSPPFESFEEYNESSYQTLDSYEQITENMTNLKLSASVEGEYFAKVSASTELQMSSTETKKIARQLQTELSKGSKVTQQIPEGHVGVKLVNGTLMKGSDNSYWMYPTSALSYSVIKLSDTDNVLNHYDLTGELYTQMAGLGSHKSIKNGYTFYS